LAGARPRRPVRAALGGSLQRGHRTGRQGYRGSRLKRMKGPGPVPQLCGDLDRIDAELLPPQSLVARAVELAVMQTAQRNREFVADLAPERGLLGEAHVVRFGRLTPTDEAGSGSDVLEMIFVAKAPRFSECKDAFVDGIGRTFPGMRPRRLAFGQLRPRFSAGGRWRWRPWSRG